MANPILADYVRTSKYARYLEGEGRRETWDEQVERVFDMHTRKYGMEVLGCIADDVAFARNAMSERLALGSQRVLQFGGDPVLKTNARVYNCTVSHANRPRFFQEAFHLLLCGCGVGFSVQTHHIAMMPEIAAPTGDEVVHVIADSIEGWANAAGVLLSSYFTRDQPFPEYAGKKVIFDASLVRPKGSVISSGSKAPGPGPLLRALESVRLLLNSLVAKAGEFVGTRVISDEISVPVYGKGQSRLKSINAFDTMMFFADAVLSGGVRRSATICVFSADDEEMINAKAFNRWFDFEPQRRRANISAVLLRGSTDFATFQGMMERTKLWGEPGFVWTDDLELVVNPCVEIGMWPCLEIGGGVRDLLWAHFGTQDGEESSWATMSKLAQEYKLLPGSTSGIEYRNGSYRLPGWQMCNLATMNGKFCATPEIFYDACRAASVISTLQAGYTEFDYLGPVTNAIVEREALLGVSMTGMMDNHRILFDPEVLRRGAEIVKETNARVADALGIRHAARTTCVKPEGKSSLLLETLAAGVHPWPSRRGIRHVRASVLEAPYQHLKAANPHAIYNLPKTDPNHENTEVVAFTYEAPEHALTQDEVGAMDLLEMVLTVRRNWIEPGTRPELCTRKWLRHNVSNTIHVKDDEWDEVAHFIFDNRDDFAGVALLSKYGDKFYDLAPNTSVHTPEEQAAMFGKEAVTQAELLVHNLPESFGGLWSAVSIAHNPDREMPVQSQADVIAQTEWLAGFYQFADECFEGDRREAEVCVKEVECWKRYVFLSANFTEVDWSTMREDDDSVEWVGGMDGACDGAKCEIDFSQMAPPSK